MPKPCEIEGSLKASGPAGGGVLIGDVAAGIQPLIAEEQFHFGKVVRRCDAALSCGAVCAFSKARRRNQNEGQDERDTRASPVSLVTK